MVLFLKGIYCLLFNVLFSDFIKRKQFLFFLLRLSSSARFILTQLIHLVNNFFKIFFIFFIFYFALLKLYFIFLA